LGRTHSRELGGSKLTYFIFTDFKAISRCSPISFAFPLFYFYCKNRRQVHHKNVPFFLFKLIIHMDS